MHIDKRTAWK